MDWCPPFEALYVLTLRATALVGCACAIDRMLGRGPAARHRLVWSAVVLGLPCLPLADRVLPTWRLGVLGLGGAPPPPPGLMQTVVVLWILGAGLVLAFAALQRTRLDRLLATAVPAPSSWMLQARGMAGATRRAVNVRVVVADAEIPPLTFGLLAPVVVLPAAAARWSAARRDAVLRHEMAHVRRGDAAFALLSWTARSLLWFHPGAWLAARWLARASERACDEAVVASGVGPGAYASHLLGIAEQLRGPAPAGLSIGGSDLAQRLRALGELPRPSAHPLATAALAVLLALGILGSATLRPGHPDHGGARARLSAPR